MHLYSLLGIMAEYELVQTNMQKLLALHDGFQYRLHRTAKNGIKNWACVKDRSRNCKGRMSTKDGKIQPVCEHVCKSDQGATEVRKQMCNLKKRAREDEELLSQVYRDEFDPLVNKGYEFVTEVPSFSSIKRTMQRIPRSALNMPPEPSSLQEISIPEDIIKMKDGRSFLLIEDGVEDKILIFASTKGREAIAEHAMFFMDGTFKSCSKQFIQVYTIHVDVRSTSEESNIVPVVYTLLPKKSRQVYQRFFNILKNCTRLEPTIC